MKSNTNSKKFLYDVDPIVIELLNEGLIDASSFYITDHFSIPHHKLILHTAMLIAYHPKINSAYKQIRNTIQINRSIKYPFGNLEEIYLLKHKLAKEGRDKFENEVTKFFSNQGRNLPQAVWRVSIEARILTGILPVPHYCSPFELINLSERKRRLDAIQSKGVKLRSRNPASLEHEALDLLQNYPVIVIREKVDSVKPLAQFIIDELDKIKDTTKDLPIPPAKRVDVDITKLAIGLWSFYHRNKGNSWLANWANQKYEENEKYFGKYSPIGKDELSNFKSDAIGHLKRLSPYVNSDT